MKNKNIKIEIEKENSYSNVLNKRLEFYLQEKENLKEKFEYNLNEYKDFLELLKQKEIDVNNILLFKEKLKNYKILEKNKNDLLIKLNLIQQEHSIIKSKLENLIELKNELEEKKEEKSIKSDNKSESIIHSEKNELLPEDEFSKIIFENINLIRENPQNFVQMIEDSKKNIIVENNKFKYKSKVKVGLIRGEPAFDEAIAILKLNSPMPKLYFNPNLTIRLPSTIEEIQDKKYFPNQIKNLSNKGIIVNTFWRDNINDPLTSFILMIVDDYKDKGEKRNDILNPNNKSIGICSTMIDNYFACYLVFSQE